MSGGMCADSGVVDRTPGVAPGEVDGWARLSRDIGARFTDGPVYAAAVGAVMGVTPDVVTVHHRGDLAAAMALSTRRRGPITVATLVGDGLGQGGDIVAADPAAARLLADRLAQRRIALRIDQLSADSLLLAALRSDPRWRVRTAVASEIPLLTMAPDATARDVRSSRTISQLRSARTKYDRSGDAVQFELLQTEADLVRRWDDMRRVASRRGETRPERDEWLSGDRGELVRQVLVGEARAGRMRVLGITAGGVWVGHDIGVLCGTTWARYLTHFDPDHGRLQPGHQMLAWIVDHHRELGVDRIHHGRGASAVKAAWSNSSVDAYDVWAVPTTITAAGPVFGVLTARNRVRAGVDALRR